MNFKAKADGTFKSLSIQELEAKILKNRKDIFSLRVKRSLNQKFKPHEFRFLKYEYNSLLLTEYQYYLNKLLSN